MVLTNITKSYGTQEVLKSVSFILNEQDKLALVGVNGAGKTTLFRIILGQELPDSGEVVFKKGVKLGYLAQDMALNHDATIYEELISVFAPLIRLEEDIRKLEAELGGLIGDEQSAAMERYSRMMQDFEQARGYEYQSRARGVLKGLGFVDEEHRLPIRSLSGGQRTRVALGKLLLTEPDILLLDEPTNHLDIHTTAWLEDYLSKEYKKSIIIISHDRYFIDRACNTLVEIEHGIAKYYKGNYSFFVDKKATDFEIELKHYETQQKYIKKQEQSIALLKSFNREKSVRRARSKEKQLAKVDRLDKPLTAPDTMRIALNPQKQSGNDVLTIKNAEKTFGSRQLFANVNMEVKRGEVAAIIGDNGVGKTTLFNMIREEGAGIALGAGVVIGYYDQHMSNIDHKKTIFQEISDSYPKLTITEVRDALAAFLFVGDDVFKDISSLSGGERGRVSLAKLMLSSANFLMMDEPTNHLDLFSKEILENALLSYKGTVLYISHDRYFINNTATKLYEMKAEGSTLYLGNYDYYMEKRQELSPPTDKSEGKKADVKPNKPQQSLSKNKLERIKMQVAASEKELGVIEAELAKDEVNTDHAKLVKLLDRKHELEEGLLTMYEELGS